jgi:hypothetical protein
MTEHEYIQDILYNFELMRSWGMDFVTVFFAYIVTSHLFGKTLPRFIAVMITMIYTGFSIPSVFALIESCNHAANMTQALNASYPDTSFKANVTATQALLATLTPLVFAWAGSIIYIRRSGVHENA